MLLPRSIALLLAWVGSAASAHSCWIERVVTERHGVRVFYDRGGMGGGYGPYDSDFMEADRPLDITRTPHGSCTLEVHEMEGRIGVRASWLERLPGKSNPDTGTEWIEAMPPSPPYIYPSKEAVPTLIK